MPGTRPASFRRPVHVLIALTAAASAAVLAVVPATGAPRADVAGRANHVTYFFVPNVNTRPFRITPGPDGNLWFTDTDASMIGRITPSGQITEFDVGAGKYPYDIVAGADGNLWFTERDNNKIGVVNTSGQLVHEYYAPGVDARPTGIAAGPNGDIWFVEGGSGEDITDDVGRITPDGTVTTYHLYDCACFPIGITTGADGNLWVAEEEGVANGNTPGTIDRISPDGATITRFPVPQSNGEPGHLPAFVAPGPDSNVWFSEYASDLHQVGRVTPNGAMKEFAVPASLTNTVSVVTGPDGQLWVTEGDANTVAVLAPTGSFLTSYAVHQLPSGITTGPDGNVWFANALSGEIGRIRIARPGTTTVLDIAPGFAPATATVALGSTVRWMDEAPDPARVVDATGLALYRSVVLRPVSFFSYAPTAAGTYPYADARSGHAGTIAVPVYFPPTVQPGTGIHVTWATAAPPAGDVFDVEVQTPDSSAWQAWEPATTATNGTYMPAAAGTYAFRARLRNPATGAASGWSPPRSITGS